MGFRAWVCLATFTLVACGAPSMPDAGGGGTGGGETGGGSGGGGGTGVANDTCQTAEAITEAGTIAGSTKGATKNYAPECTGFPNEGEDVVYAVTVPAGNRVKLRVGWIDPTAPAFDPSLYIIGQPAESCDAVLADAGSGIECLAGSDESDGASESLEWLNNAATERTVFVVVDSYRGRAQVGPDGGIAKATSGDFILEVAFEQPVAGDACSNATQLVSGTALTQQLLAGFTNDYLGSATCAGSTGVDRAYRITVPAGDTVTVTVTPTSGLDPMLSAATSAASCNATCVANADTGTNGAAETLIWKNSGAAPVELFVVVDAYGATTGVFSILATLATPGADDVCDGATALVPGTPLNHTTVGYSNAYSLQTGFTGCASSGYNGPDRTYTFAVPPMQRGRVVVTPAAATFNPSLNVLSSALAMCSAMPRVCSTGTNVGGNGAAETVSVVNTGANALEHFAFVDSTGPGGAYEIAYTVDTPPADDTCISSETVVLDAGTLNGTLTGFVHDYGSVGAGCFGAGGPDRVYRARLEAGEKLATTLTPAHDGGFDGVINFIVGTAASCEALPRTCVGGIDFTVRNQAESGAYSNSSSAPIELFVVVGDYEKNSSDTDFTLATTISPIPAGESCERPIVTGAQSFPAQTLVGASSDTSFAGEVSSCIATSGLPDEVYEVEVPPGKELVAIATPAAGTNLAMNLVEGSCRGITACLANANAGGASAAETLRWTNSGAAMKTVRLIVVGVPAGAYTLELRIP